MQLPQVVGRHVADDRHALRDLQRPLRGGNEGVAGNEGVEGKEDVRGRGFPAERMFRIQGTNSCGMLEASAEILCPIVAQERGLEGHHLCYDAKLEALAEILCSSYL